jgi:hypothetical protein
MKMMKRLTLTCMMIAPVHAVQILTETESFIHTQNAAGTSNSKVNGSIVLPESEKFPGVSNSFLIFGDARNELKVPTRGITKLGEARTGGYLAVINKVDFGGGKVEWTTGSNDEGEIGDKVGVIQGIDQVPENELKDNSITTVADASFVDRETFWICGTIEGQGPDGVVFEVKVGGLGPEGTKEQRYPWDRPGKAGYLMKWGLSSFTPSLMIALTDPVSSTNFYPAAVAALKDESVLVMCVDKDENWFLRKYHSNGEFEWSWSFPDVGAKGVQLIEGKGSEAGKYFVLAEVSPQGGARFGGQDVVLYCVTPNPSNKGADLEDPWHGTVLGGKTDDFAGAMISHPDGTLSVAFTVEAGLSVFPLLEENSYGDLTKEHCIVVNLQKSSITGRVGANWTQTAAKAIPDPRTTRWTMRANRLSSDPLGNLHLGITGNGLYEIECVNRTLTGRGGLISIDGTSRVWDFKRLPGFSTIGGVLGIGVEEQIVLGDNGTGMTMSVFRPEAVQNSYVVHAVDPLDADSAMKSLVSAVTELGGQVHLEMRHERFGIFCVGAFLTPEQLVDLEADDTLSVDPDPQIITQNSGQGEEQTGAGWALRRLNQHEDEAAGLGSSYQFWLDDGVEGVERPWVFLLDTGLPELRINDLSGSRFAPKSPFDPSRPVEMGWAEEILEAPIGANAEHGEYVVNVNSDHAEKVTKLMAFQPFGSGQGIPFRLENINIYPDRGTGVISTYPSYIADGIFLAVDRVLDEREAPTGPKTGALIVIPSSGQSTVALTEFDTLERALDEALAANIAIVLSAGNTENAPVEMNVPAGYGSRAGIITVGATKHSEAGVLNARAQAQTIDSSGTNETITLYAPGVAVPVGGGGETIDGTSASCALAAGVAAAILSNNPEVTPEVLENTMIANGVFQSSDMIQLLTLNIAIPRGCEFENWLIIHDLVGDGLWADGDGDGLTNLEEYLGESDPTDSISRSGPILLPKLNEQPWTLEIELPTWTLLSTEPFHHLDLGCDTVIEVVLEWSSDLVSWTPNEPADWYLGQPDIARRVTPLSFTVPVSLVEEKRFWRFILRQLPPEGP